LLAKGRVLTASLVLALVTALFAAFALPAAAQPVEAQFWHAMGGRLGEVVQELVDRFNRVKTSTGSPQSFVVTTPRR